MDDRAESLSPAGFVRFGSDGEWVDQRLRVVFAEVDEQLVNELPTAHSELFGGDFTYLANGTNLISFKNDLFEIMNGFVDFTKDSIDKYDDIISNICNNLFTVGYKYLLK